ncbi:gag/pol protein [Cucumis melo var. makuwa]|uniref:Gag/pol protein n=1 Tax=Cucumis melo var. makuwa TaxID=1194695 RepID=A0A5A7V359_CUCMM|nr:gag/pol protein [Cucumis melo var. makuwa]TYK09886.1 gag/pol protein [Cucumis melo var. makuwa]
MSDVLAKKHEFLATTKEIMDSLKGMFGQREWSLKHKAVKYIHSKRMKEGTSVREHVLDMMTHFNIAEVNGGAIDDANQEISSWKRLFEGEITLKVGTGEMVSAKAVRDLKLFFNDRYILLKNVLIGRLVKNGLLRQLEDNFLPPCDSCLEGKMTKRSFTGKGLRAKTPLELVHSDLCGPINVKARGGYEYFISFIYDYSRYDHVYLIHNKSDSFEKFKEYKAEVENELGKTIKTFRSDRGGEYMDLQFQDYLIEYGIQSQLFAPSTLQQNGVSERRNRTLLDMVQSMMSFAQLPDSFWRYALETTIYILNNVPSKSVSETPYELWKGRKVDKTRNIGQTHPSRELGEPRRSGRVVRQPDRYLGLSEAQTIIPEDGIEDLLTYKQAIHNVDYDQWIKAMDLEMESMYSNSVWTLVDQPNGIRPIGCK